MKPQDERGQTSWTLVGRIKNVQDQESWTRFYDLFWLANSLLSLLSPVQTRVNNSARSRSCPPYPLENRAVFVSLRRRWGRLPDSQLSLVCRP